MGLDFESDVVIFTEEFYKDIAENSDQYNGKININSSVYINQNNKEFKLGPIHKLLMIESQNINNNNYSFLNNDEESDDDQTPVKYSKTEGYLCHPSWKRIDHDPIIGPVSLLDKNNISESSLLLRALTTCYFPRVRHIFQSQHSYPDNLPKTAILICAEHINCFSRCRYDVTIREPEGNETERQCEIKCSYQGEHRKTKKNNQKCEITLKAKQWIHKRKLLFGYGAQKVIDRMVQESNIKGVDNEIDFPIPKLQPMITHLKTERKFKEKMLATKNLIKSHLKSITCTSFAEIESKKLGGIGSMIVVDQYDFEYFAYKKSDDGTITKECIQAIGFNFITLKMLMNYLFMLKYIDGSDPGVFLNVDYVHNLFTNDFVLGVAGVTVIATGMFV
jgi:hypothetical protein